MARIVQLDVQEHEDNYRVLMDVIISLQMQIHLAIIVGSEFQKMMIVMVYLMKIFLMIWMEMEIFARCENAIQTGILKVIPAIPEF